MDMRGNFILRSILLEFLFIFNKKLESNRIALILTKQKIKKQKSLFQNFH
ncbi:hypothetical protein CPK_ORF01081 [Chlamydia pneumoniae LPCoLN]|nr:hypothetical protein CPK_ORF01081 [Chlamydia pneumoniae LPCoLN]ETR80473.1 hypothetical protein X556_0203 [Chlamydia pneumoniae B21]CRI42681.1 Uncharacterized protein BN1224_DC9_BU_00060 [Chlamydia pneumoniae]CRI43815.1 Uncharacterized protein BN1224_H12_EI_00050 [Chlamydia pneumoniae]CRI48349.1 Uncharacterized protein BN1224_PB2_A_05900 [Chlamydia pneumoniae]